MNMIVNVVLAVQMLAALGMIGLVLVQHGKGADMGASFGSGSSGSLFGASGSANFLSRSTAVCAVFFFAATLYLAYSANTRQAGATGSVLDRPNAGASAPATSASGAAAIPMSASGAAPTIVVPSSAPAATTPIAAPATSASGAGAIPSK